MFEQKEFIQFLEKPQKERDQKWEQDFLKNFPQCKVTLTATTPQVGPDQFPYMFAEIKEDSTESALQLLHWISQNAVGLAINPRKTYPDFVFTYGMVWNFFKTGQFLENPVAAHVHGPNCNHDHHKEPANSNIKSGTTVYAGTPSEAYLPKAVRMVLKEFLKQQGVMAPKAIMLSMDQKNFDLCFSIESFGSPEVSEHEGILQGLSWFLPAHYSLAFVSEESLSKNGIPTFEEI